jgi:hypothetical protein
MSPVSPIAASYLTQGVLTWAFPLAVFLAVLAWYVVMVLRRHPD